MKIGIEKINLYIPPFYLDLKDLAQRRGVDPNKYTKGLMQEKMALCPIEQDIVVMAARAAQEILDENDKKQIDMIIVATESAFDYSKAAATYLQEMLGIQPYCRTFEIKEACYGGTAALQLARDYVASHPQAKVLVVTTDISKYGLETGGEVTQGAGAMAMLISNQPNILEMNATSVFYTDHQHDFFRPEGSDYAIVDGQFSNQLYGEVFLQCFRKFYQDYPEQVAAISRMHFHLPYAKMGQKALDLLMQTLPDEENIQQLVQDWLAAYPLTNQFNKQVGNIYTGSLYLSILSSLMDINEDLSGQTIGAFSYGSGAVGEIFTMKVADHYRNFLNIEGIQLLFNRRQALSIDEYEALFKETIHKDSLGNWQSPAQPIESGWNLIEIKNHQRIYKLIQ